MVSITLAVTKITFKVAVITSSVGKTTIVVPQITFKVAVITFLVAKITFVVSEITFKVYILYLTEIKYYVDLLPLNLIAYASLIYHSWQ